MPAELPRLLKRLQVCWTLALKMCQATLCVIYTTTRILYGMHVYMGASSFSGVSGIGSSQALSDFGRSPKAFSEGALKRFGQ